MKRVDFVDVPRNERYYFKSIEGEMEIVVLAVCCSIVVTSLLVKPPGKV